MWENKGLSHVYERTFHIIHISTLRTMVGKTEINKHNMIYFQPSGYDTYHWNSNRGVTMEMGWFVNVYSSIAI